MEKQKRLFTFKDCPTYHKSDDHYNKHCVDCGYKLAEYERVWNGYDRPEIGKTLLKEWCSFDFGGRRCETCYNKLKDFIELEFYGH